MLILEIVSIYSDAGRPGIYSACTTTTRTSYDVVESTNGLDFLFSWLGFEPTKFCIHNRLKLSKKTSDIFAFTEKFTCIFHVICVSVFAIYMDQHSYATLTYGIFFVTLVWELDYVTDYNKQQQWLLLVPLILQLLLLLLQTTSDCREAGRTSLQSV